ncbi:MAG: electron transfer flavoprotein subunit beta/FixA family protein [Deltaproteobacteria bacterium]|nr:electron transfer flavoprotein subunit beta/FixA family protein [Deltaproteobacteria bacterium]
MNIVVCLHFFPDPNIISFDDGRIDPEDLIYTVHPSDLVAVEAAVSLKEKNGSGKVFLVALSSPAAENLIRHCLSRGADEATLIESTINNVDGYSMAVLLAAWCRTMNIDLILCGHGSMDNFGGQTGYVMADRLNLPIVSRVTKLDLLMEKKELVLEKKLEGGYRERSVLPLPALLTLEESLNEPRYATLPGLLCAQEAEIRRKKEIELNLTPEDTPGQARVELLNMKKPKPRPKKIFTPDTTLSAEDRMWQIMSGGLAEKNKECFEGSPEELGRKFLEYLTQLGLSLPNRDGP